MHNVRALHLVLLAFLGLGCTDCTGDDGVRVDAGPDAADPLPILPARSAAMPYVLSGMKQTPDGKQLVYCAIEGVIGFFDLETFTPVEPALDLKPLTDLFDRNKECRLTVIGDSAYAYYGSPYSPARAVVFKVDIANRTVEAVWELPSEYANLNWNPLKFSGVNATGDPSLGVLTSYQLDYYQGALLLYLDLSTGEVTEDQLIPVPGAGGSEIYAVYGGDRVFGQVLADHVHAEPFYFIANRVTREVLARPKPNAGGGPVAPDPELGRLILSDVPSAGWEILDPDTGESRGHFEFVQPGFFNYMVSVDAGRVAHAASGSFGESWITLMDATDGRGLGIASLPTSSIMDLIVSPDRRDLYAAGSRLIIHVPVPEDASRAWAP